MGKKAWVKPVTLVQKFEANEPCAADPCWRVKCEWTEGAHGFCNEPENYRFIDDDGNGKADRMQIYHETWVFEKWQNCEFFTDGSFKTSLGTDLEKMDIKPGQVVFFTNYDGVVPYNHSGKVYAVNPSRPNRS